MLKKEIIKVKHNNQIIHDFIESRNDLDGCGYFKGDHDAIKYAQEGGINQKRNYQKRGIIPKSLIKMFAQYFVLQGRENPIYRDLKYPDFITLLMKGPYKSEAARQIGEKFYRDLLCADMPWVRRSFAMNDGFYKGHEKRRPSKRDAREKVREVGLMIA